MDNINIVEEIIKIFELEYLHANIMSDNDNTTISFEYPEDDIIPESIIRDAQISLLRFVREATGENIKPFRLVSPYNYSESVIDELQITPEKSFYTNLVQFDNRNLSLIRK